MILEKIITIDANKSYENQFYILYFMFENSMVFNETSLNKISVHPWPWPTEEAFSRIKSAR
ncbi:MAG: hypothetical protein BGO01_00175 [Armatimonadetes bacterium 55-13]|nr:MAG: hypothetical protein BGO01_00175 [Armatimonadetes bacterium 55-13]